MSTLKEKVIYDLRNMSQDIRLGCACKMFSPQEMADEVENDTKHGKDHMKVMEHWEEHKHEFGL